MKKDTATDTTKATEKPTCGIIMPISECVSNGVTYTASHWESMRLFLEDAISEAGYEPKPVWEGEDQSVIHARIVNNISDFPLMVCVICGSNVNVMIELGLRLMTDKPVFVIYDENTSPPFDVNVLKMFSFSPNPDYKDYKALKEKIKNVLPKMLEQDYKSFLSNFKTITPKGVSGTEQVELAQFMNDTREAIQDIRSQISKLALQRERDSMDFARMRALPMSTERMLQRDFTDREHLFGLYRAKLFDLRRKIEILNAGDGCSGKDLDGLEEELRMIRSELVRNGIEDYPPIKRSYLFVRDAIEMRRHQNRIQEV